MTGATCSFIIITFMIVQYYFNLVPHSPENLYNHKLALGLATQPDGAQSPQVSQVIHACMCVCIVPLKLGYFRQA